MPKYFVQKTDDDKTRVKVDAINHKDAAHQFVEEHHGDLYEKAPGPVSVREFRKDEVHHFEARVIWEPEVIINAVRTHKRRKKR